MANDDEIAASKFTLCDSNGNVRALLATGSDGVPYLNFYADFRAPPRLAVSLDSDGSPYVTLFRGNKIALSIGVSETGAGISVNDCDGIPRVIVGLSDNAAPVVELRDEEGNAFWTTADLSEG